MAFLQTAQSSRKRQWFIAIVVGLLAATGCSSSGDDDDAAGDGGVVLVASQYFNDANVDDQVATIGVVITNTTGTQLTLDGPVWEESAPGFTLRSAGYQLADNPDETLNQLPDQPDLASTLILDDSESAVLGAQFNVDCDASPLGALTLTATTPDTTDVFDVGEFAVVSSADANDWPTALHTRICDPA